jgi:L-asparaginase
VYFYTVLFFLQEEVDLMQQRVVFLGTGGTIAGQAQSSEDNVSYQAAQIEVGQLLEAIPGLKGQLRGAILHSEQVFQRNSKDLDPSHWQQLQGRVVHYLSQADVQAIVITHGTDTAEETAYFLARTIPAALLRLKPVVLTCAMRPATSAQSDGPQNMVDALCVATTQGAYGVLLVCSATVHSALRVQKVHPYRLDAFDSGEAGPVGAVEEGQLRLFGAWPDLLETVSHQAFSPQAQIKLDWPRVEIVMSHAGATGAIVRALCAPVSQSDSPLRGIVVAGTGNGDIHHGLAQSLQDAQSHGVRIVRTTRCATGSVVLSQTHETDPTLFEASPLSAVKARIALMLELLD